MKTVIKQSAAVIVLLLCLFSFSSKAQIPGPGPFNITNNTLCSIDIKWTVLDASNTPCLNSGGTVTMLPGSVITISPAQIATSCGGFANDILVDFQYAYGTPFTGGPYIISTTSGAITANEVDCTGATYSFNLNCLPSDIFIN